MILDRIEPLKGTQEYLLANWIPPSEFEKVRTIDGRPDVYHDHTYDWYGGVARAIHPHSILEIGVYRGYSLAAMLYGADERVEHVTAIDNGYEMGVGVPCEAVNRLKTEFKPTKFHLMLMDSQQAGIISQCTQFDLIHIDADHSYEGCLNDLKHFAPLVSEKGVVIVHDTLDEPVKRALDDFLTSYPLKCRLVPTVKGNAFLARK